MRRNRKNPAGEGPQEPERAGHAGTPEDPLDLNAPLDEGETAIYVTSTEVVRSGDPLGPLTDPDPLEPPPSVPPGKTKTRVNKTVWVMAIIAVVSLGLGVALSRFVISPAEAAANAEPPEAGPITVAAENRVISSDVVARGDAVYDDAVQVKIEASETGGGGVVTGAVPEVGTVVEAGMVLLEVKGRPVIVLPGELPVYRTLQVGASGPDVVQLQASLGEMGFDAGASGVYDAATASAVAALFTQAGYTPPEPPEGTEEALEQAQQAVNSAQTSLDRAKADLTAAQAGPPQSTRIENQNGVNSAQRTLNLAKKCTGVPEEEAVGTDCEGWNGPSVGDAQDALNLAIATRDEALQVDTSGEVASRDGAQRELDSAIEALSKARDDVLTPLPASEIIFLANLPRRVDSVAVERGSTISGSVMSISGAVLEIVAKVDDADAALLTVGQEATLTSGDLEIPATIAELNAADTRNQTNADGTTNSNSNSNNSANDNRTEVVLHPTDLTEEQRSQIVGTNVRVTIPVESTGGEVLAVPVAALTAGAGGETRVEVMRPGAEAPELVIVETGLAADGYVQIVSSEPAIKAGDLVVVGQSDGATSGSGDEATSGSGGEATEGASEESSDAATEEG